jgi:deoxyribodipyrimidine photo-lyase
MKDTSGNIAVFWFRRDLRLQDNTALSAAVQSGLPVLPLFIVDEDIIRDLPADDPRLSFIYKELEKLHEQFRERGSGLYCLRGAAEQVWTKILDTFSVKAVYANKDYEPASIRRDDNIARFLRSKGSEFFTYKDHVIFEEDEIVKSDGLPYTVFTPYKKKWLDMLNTGDLQPSEMPAPHFYEHSVSFPSAKKLGITLRDPKVREFDLRVQDRYAGDRDYPARDAGSYLGPHLRFGTVSIREIVRRIRPRNEVFLSELIWREFFMQILIHYPRVVDENFREKYNGISWRNDEKEFELWRRGRTGYAMVDAGMRQLNESGYMHNRVRMVTASFLCKHLLIDWRWGERYFAEKLLDYELSSNNGNWQWAAGTGCDAAPYFRIFNPVSQQKKFDKDLRYIKKWVPELGTFRYSEPMVDHNHARKRALDVYKKALNN